MTGKRVAGLAHHVYHGLEGSGMEGLLAERLCRVLGLDLIGGFIIWWLLNDFSFGYMNKYLLTSDSTLMTGQRNNSIQVQFAK